jgi:hypothetical protein
MILQSVITCPECGTAKLETMPTDACQFFYVCTGCGTKLRPNGIDNVHPLSGREIRALRQLRRENMESRYVFVTCGGSGLDFMEAVLGLMGADLSD